MKKKARSNDHRLIALLIMSAFIVTCAAVITGGYARTGYSLEVGAPSPFRFVADRDVINAVATNKLKDDARKSVMDIYVPDNEATETIQKQIDDLFKQIYDLRKMLSPIFTPTSADIPNNTTGDYDYSALSERLTQPQIDELLSMDTQVFNNLQNSVMDIVNDALEKGVRPDTQERSITDAKQQMEALDFTPSQKTLANDILSDYIKPNRVVDVQETQRRRDEKADEVINVIHLKNQKIVDENEIITEEAYGLLQTLGLINRSVAENVMPSVGAVIVTAIIFIFSMMYIDHFHKELKGKRKMLLLVFTLYISIILLSWALAGYNYFFVPILLFTMLISMLISHRLSIFLNFGVTVITHMIFKGDIDYLVYYLITGTAIGVLAIFTTERNKVIFVGLLSAFVNIGIVIGYDLFFEAGLSSADGMRRLASSLVFASVSGLLSVIIATGSLPVWEALFGIVTPLKLLDLTSPNNEVLNRLTLEAPGTYHHSLIVANLAETAAHDIGANPAIARVGGYYHDIGKLKYPQYFSENMAGHTESGYDNPHDDMDIYSSMAVIKSHVDYGLEIARNYKLPAVIKDIIAQHHGTTLMKYFYAKTKNENPDEKLVESDFRYTGRIPATKEAAAVMLADTVEAAVRSMIPTGKPMDEVEEFVRSLIKDKLDDGQLEMSELTIKDLDTCAKAFMRVFKGMYHARIPYPTVK